MAQAGARFLYRSYKLFELYGSWRRSKFTQAGQVLIYGIIFTACLGVDTFRSMVYQLFSFFFCLVLLSALFSFKKKTGLTAWRILPEFATAGKTITYTLVVENHTKKSQSGWEIKEVVKDQIPSFDSFINDREPFEKMRNPWDRQLKVQRWMWLVRNKKNALFKTNSIPEISKKSRVEMKAKLTPLNRGYVHLNGFVFLLKEPLGITRSFYRITKPGKLLVLPKRYTVPELSLPGSRKHHSGGIALTSRVGDSDEFISLRDYRPGDPMRQIHWKSWAKTGKLIIRENQDEHFVRHALVLDTFSSKGSGDDFEAAVSLAASFVSTLADGESLLDLIVAGSRVYRTSSGRGLSGTRKLLEILALVKPTPEKSFLKISTTVLKYKRLLSGCILIFNTLDSDRLDLLNQLKALQIPTKAFLLTDEKTRSMEKGIYPVIRNDVQKSLNKMGATL